jgi:hypothetical protein
MSSVTNPIDDALNAPRAELDPSGATPETLPPSQTIEVTGKRDLPSGMDLAGDAAPATLPTDLPPYEYKPPEVPPIDPPAVTGGIGSEMMDFMKANPRLALSLLGTVGGMFKGDGGTGAPSGPGTGPQAGMTATQAPKFQRQYVAPPAGYRPGFDPEHKYFTGIGATGTGS